MNKRSGRSGTTLLVLGMLCLLVTACNYRFNDVSIPVDITTVKINLLENKATYINPQLAPQLSDRLRQKIVQQTRLKQTNDDNADWVVDGVITNYSFTTAGISQGQEASNRLAITVTLTRLDQKKNQKKDYSVSRNFDFAASKSIPEAESELQEKILKDITDDMFNRLFSDW